ncbi:MAG: AgmX/PglI C-terminal domain-containing protein [Myxococcaceae bacterium]|nr:AgmX/PglI C-terminal domain-containing protein [Myxococcaceae bacterium]
MSHLSHERLEALAKDGGTDAHLDSCAECRGAVQRARASRRLLGSLTPYTLSEAGFQRVELRLKDAVQRPERPFWLWPALGFATALAVVAVLTLRPGAPAPAPQVPAVAAKALELSPWPQLTVARVERGGGLTAGQVMPVEATVSAEHAELFGPGVDVSLEQGEVRFGARAELERGLLTVLAAGESLRGGHAGPTYFAASDAEYRVHASGWVSVYRGTVLVGARADLSDAVRLTAPARYEGGKVLGFEPSDALSRPARGSVPWSMNELGAWETAELDGVRFTPPYSALLAEGPHQLALRKGGSGRTVTIDLRSPTTFQAPPLPLKESAPPSESELQALQRAFAAQRPRLAECYEKWLKATPQASGEAALELTIAPSGVVTAAKVTSEDLPAEARACLVRTSRKLVMPKLAEVQTVELPLVLKVKR